MPVKKGSSRLVLNEKNFFLNLSFPKNLSMYESIQLVSTCHTSGAYMFLEIDHNNLIDIFNSK